MLTATKCFPLIPSKVELDYLAWRKLASFVLLRRFHISTLFAAGRRFSTTFRHCLC